MSKSGPMKWRYHESPVANFDVDAWCSSRGNELAVGISASERHGWETTLRNLIHSIPCESSLARLGTEISSGPHALDRTRPLGKWIIAALADWQEARLPADAEEWRRLWSAAGVVCDPLSSTVLVAGLRTSERSTPVDEKLHVSTDGGLPCVLTLYELSKHPPDFGEQKVFGVENPAVIAEALARLGASVPAIVCVSGFASVAAARLLVGNLKVHYHGDFDWNGLRIAHRLHELLDDRLTLWRFSIEEYRAGLEKRSHSEQLPEGRVPTDVGLLQDLLDEMKATSAVVFEEDVLESLLQDLEEEAAQLADWENEAELRGGR